MVNTVTCSQEDINSNNKEGFLQALGGDVGGRGQLDTPKGLK